MIKFSQFLEENPVRKDGVVICWGRFNPPTIGHETVFNEAASLANTKGFEFKIFASHSQDPKRNPLSHSLKVEYLKEIFPRYKRYIVEDQEAQFKNINEIVPKLSEEYENLIFIVGEDRVAEFHEMIEDRIEHKFKTVEVWSAGERDPDSDGVVGISASVMREFAVNGLLEDFKTGLPSGVSEEIAECLYNDIRACSKTKPPSSSLVLERPKEREEFYNGSLAEGDQVTTVDGQAGIIQEVGANHVVVVTDSEVKRYWPHDVFK